MAHCRTQLQVPLQAQDLDRLMPQLIERLGMQLERTGRRQALMMATDPPNCGLKADQHVLLLCDWTNLRNTGEVEIETRSGESMAHSQTRCRQVFDVLCDDLRALVP